MSKRHLLKLLVVAPVWAAVMTVPVAAQAVVPPLAYSNGVVLALEEHCNNEAFTELSKCPNANERNKHRSRKEPLVAFGGVFLHTTQFVEAIECKDNTFDAEVWNEHEKGVETNPERAYGLVEGWGTAQCTGKEITEFYAKEKVGERAIAKEGPLSIFATAEPKLQPEETEAITCKPEAKGETLEACEEHGETTHTLLVSFDRRRQTTLPWKVEVVRGKTSAGKEAPAERVGLAEYGECGPGVAEGTPTCGTGEAATERPSKCYPSNKKFTSVPQGCISINIVIPQIPEELPFFGSQEIVGVNGTKNGLFASTIDFEGAHTGYLESQNGTNGVGYNSGVLKEIGQTAIQLLTAN